MAMRTNDPISYIKECLSALLGQLQCAICLDTLREPVSTRCGHTFCHPCITKSVSGSNISTCPLCKGPVSRRSINENQKTQNLVKGAESLVVAISKDVGFDILKESQGPKTDLPPSTSVSSSSDNVATWLKEVTPLCPSQDSIPPKLIENPEGGESDSDFDSVSQVKVDSALGVKELSCPNEFNSKPSVLRISSQNSAFIEVDDQSVQIVDISSESNVHDLTKNPLNTRKKTYRQKVNFSKQISLKKSSNSKKEVTLNHFNRGSSALSCQQKIFICKEGGKEKSANAQPARSLIFSDIKLQDIQEHPQSFSPKAQESSKSVLRSKNSLGSASDVPSIEEPDSGEEDPCISLSLSSSDLATREVVRTIVSNLEAEIELCEKISLPEKSVKHKPAPLSNKNMRKLLQSQVQKNYKKNYGGVCSSVKFLKLGSLTSHRSVQIPFLLKGPLLHLPTRNHSVADLCLPLQQSNACTQWSPQTYPEALANLPEIPASRSGSSFEPSRKSSEIQQSLTPSQENADLMDAETVLLTQQPYHSFQDPKEAEVISSTRTNHQSVMDVQEDIINMDSNCDSQLIKNQSPTHLSIFSVDEDDNIKRPTQVHQSDFHDSSSSDFNGDRIPKRVRALSCSSNSSDSSIISSKSPPTAKKSRKSPVLSQSKDSFKFPSPHLSPLSGSLCNTDDIEASIKANIEAGLKDLERSHSADLYDPVHSENVYQTPGSQKSQNLTFEDHVNSNTQETEIIVNGDSDIIATQTTALCSRETSQSDDIVPNSQPFVIPEKPTASSSHLKIKLGQESVLKQDQSKQLPIGIKTCETVQKEKSELQIPLAKNRTLSSEFHADGSAPDQELSTSKDIPPAASINHVFASEQCISDVSVTEVKKMRFICSNLTATLVSDVQKLVALVGAEFSSKYSQDVTHLIVRVNSENAADKTLKYLCTVAAGKWVVSFQWVLDSLEAGKLMPEEPYEALDCTGEPGPKRSRLAHRDGVLLFKNFEFFCLDDFPGLSKAQMEDLVSECGAVVINDLTKFSFSDGIYPISLCAYEDHKEEEYLSWWNKHGSVLIQHDWVLDCIGQFKLTSLYPMILCDTPEDLVKIGFPPYLVEPDDSDP